MSTQTGDDAMIFPISRRKTLLFFISGLSGCAAMTTTNIQGQSRMVVDDGISEITPVYVITHNESQSSTFVRADFYFYDAKKEVELQPGASIKVNGIELQHDPKTLASYIGNIPMPHGLLTFEFMRTPGKVIKHSFALPELDIAEFPNFYRVGEQLAIVVNPRASRPGVEKDIYGVDIQGNQGLYGFVSEPAGSLRMIFRPILKNVGFPSGLHEAHIFRQQRTPLKNLSNDLQTGWAVASRSRDFTIEVVN
jgi:hypothetical protein